jgi:hypothetical protein
MLIYIYIYILLVVPVTDKIHFEMFVTEHFFNLLFSLQSYL